MQKSKLRRGLKLLLRGPLGSRQNQEINSQNLIHVAVALSRKYPSRPPVSLPRMSSPSPAEQQLWDLVPRGLGPREVLADHEALQGPPACLGGAHTQPLDGNPGSGIASRPVQGGFVSTAFTRGGQGRHPARS